MGCLFQPVPFHFFGRLGETTSHDMQHPAFLEPDIFHTWQGTPKKHLTTSHLRSPASHMRLAEEEYVPEGVAAICKSHAWFSRVTAGTPISPTVYRFLNNLK